MPSHQLFGELRGLVLKTNSWWRQSKCPAQERTCKCLRHWLLTSPHPLVLWAIFWRMRRKTRRASPLSLRSPHAVCSPPGSPADAALQINLEIISTVMALVQVLSSFMWIFATASWLGSYSHLINLPSGLNTTAHLPAQTQSDCGPSLLKSCNVT